MAKKIKTQAKTGTAVKSKPVLRESFFRRNSFETWLFVLVFVVFANGIGNKYALDDEFYTAGGNKYTQKGLKGIPGVFKTRTFNNNDGSSYSYRPITLTTFAIETQFFGENPHVSHFFNVLLYAITIVLLFRLLRKWFVTQGDWFSFFICLLFMVHPLHSEVVDNIKCRDELLAFLFILLCFHAIWKHLETKKPVWLILFPVYFLLGMLSKRTTVPFYALIPLAMWFFTDTKPWKIALYVIPLFVVTYLPALLLKHTLETQTTREYLPFENPLAFHPGFATVTATSFYVIGRYLYLFFIPYPLVYYYGSFYVPDVTWSNPVAIISLVIYAAIGIWTLLELRKKSILGFGLLFFLINIAAYSNLLQPAPGIMAERYTYAASLGFSIVIVLMIFRLMKKNPEDFRWKSPDFSKIRFAFVAIALLMTIRTFWRTGDWENKDTLYGHDMEFLHESVKANMLYGALISKEALELNFRSRVSDGKGGVQIDQQKQQEAFSKFMEARGYYQKAAELAPYYHTAWSNLGTGYFFTGDTKTALYYFKKGVSIKGDYAEGWYNVGMAYDKLGVNDSAVYAFQKSIKSDSSYVSSYEQLSRLIMQNEKDPQKALNLLRTAARKKPDSEVPWNNMANIYFQLRDTAQAAGAMERAAEINPDNVQRLYNLAFYFQKKGDAGKFNFYYHKAEAGKKKMEEQQKKQQEEQ
jgi:tetratricopeptide (TPR) repeat protein